MRRTQMRRLWSLSLLTALLCLLAGLAGPGASADPGPFGGDSGQVITVFAPSPSATSATLTAWDRGADGSWRVVAGPMAADVGSDGIGQASEAASRTPAGTFPLTVAFGRLANPGTAMPYFRTDSQDWWDENPLSPTYNTHVRGPVSPGGNSENLYESGSVYDYAVNIGYNLARIPGAGSGIFLHVSAGTPTAGCVSVPENSMQQIVRWLDPARRPVIDIGVGTAPTP
ncbi:L,D-transpeptidase family protein [Rhodococcus sp. D2-41]|uniref:L,D-transpeptidase family protein n=1 Tax=Speluncibacter jeojiensis TaxID=2710754 RepID=UPI00240F0314|nr:L,D-transpeptidase family protein [Rhodococcus sp. D2-41]MDG3012341.1 L,D-transpeptidase family protein [Rhodococcus sp. D2-41]